MSVIYFLKSLHSKRHSNERHPSIYFVRLHNYRVPPDRHRFYTLLDILIKPPIPTPSLPTHTYTLSTHPYLHPLNPPIPTLPTHTYTHPWNVCLRKRQRANPPMPYYIIYIIIYIIYCYWIFFSIFFQIFFKFFFQIFLKIF